MDTNGAGDAFVGGFLSQLLLGKDTEASVKGSPPPPPTPPPFPPPCPLACGLLIPVDFICPRLSTSACTG